MEGYVFEKCFTTENLWEGFPEIAETWRAVEFEITYSVFLFILVCHKMARLWSVEWFKTHSDLMVLLKIIRLSLSQTPTWLALKESWKKL